MGWKIGGSKMHRSGLFLHHSGLFLHHEESVKRNPLEFFDQTGSANAKILGSPRTVIVVGHEGVF